MAALGAHGSRRALLAAAAAASLLPAQVGRRPVQGQVTCRPACLLVQGLLARQEMLLLLLMIVVTLMRWEN